MRRLLPTLNPVARKRWRRFRETRRAWWALWILAALYALSLGSELLCNDRPLYVRCNGRSYFPVVRYYPDHTFTESGLNTRPDYKAIRASEEFRRYPRNRMVFPPVPFGPNEIIDPASIALPDEVTLTLEPVRDVGAVNLAPDYRITRALSAQPFLGVPDSEATGTCLTNTWALPPDLRAAIAERFANRAAPALTTPLEPIAAGDGEPQPMGPAVPRRSSAAEAVLSDYVPRDEPPLTVRLTLRDPTPPAAQATRLRLDARRRVHGGAKGVWTLMPAAVQSNLLTQATARFERAVEPLTVTVGGRAYRATFDREGVRWPFRPIRGHWLGVDNTGRDVLARILYGLRTSMTFGLILVIASMTLGAFLGAVQGYYGGWVDITGQRLTEIWSALPFLYIMILLGSVYGRSFALLLICYGIFNWIGISYYMRAEFLRLRRQPFVQAARAIGLPSRGIIFRHILPNALVPIVTFFPFSLVSAIGSLAALDYLGFGLPPPTPSWGELLQQAQQFRWAWWLIAYPFLAIFIVMLLGVFVGEGARNAYDPRRASRLE
jgi:microcin C transport system permease protein